jgi:hypothetical protein
MGMGKDEWDYMTTAAGGGPRTNIQGSGKFQSGKMGDWPQMTQMGNPQIRQIRMGRLQRENGF